MKVSHTHWFRPREVSLLPESSSLYVFLLREIVELLLHCRLSVPPRKAGAIRAVFLHFFFFEHKVSLCE